MPRRPRFLRPAVRPEGRPRDKQERDRFYTGAAWRRCRAAVLQKQPLCRDCEDAGRLTAATMVHHLVERLERPDLAFDAANLLGLCNPCHTARHKRAPGGG